MALHFAFALFGRCTLQYPFRRTFAALALLIALNASNPRLAAAEDPTGAPEPKTSPPATAVEAYDLGCARLKLDDLKGAEAAFRKSGELAAKMGIDFAPPHEGMARVLLRKKKLLEADYEGRTATGLDPAWIKAWWVLAKVAEQEQNDELALTYYEQGFIIDPANDELTDSAVELLHRLGRENRVREIEAKHQAAKGAKMATAPPDSTGDPLAKARERLAPFFQASDMPTDPALLSIFLGPVFTRGALAVLISGNGGTSLGKALDGGSGYIDGSFRTPSDVSGRPEATWINRALSIGLMETLPDGTFRPDEPVTRQTLSLWAEETISHLKGNSKVFSLYRGSESPFPDVPKNHYAYNAARIAVDLKLVQPLSDGSFALDRPVAMDEGIAAMRRFVPSLLGTTPR